MAKPTAAITSQKQGVNDAVIDSRAILIGLVVAAGLCLAGFAWKLASNPENLKKSPPKEFEFSLAPPPPDEFKIKPLTPDIAHERPDDSAALAPSLPDEKPNIHISVNPNNVAVDTEVIQSPNTAINNNDMELKIDVKSIDTTLKNTEITDAPEEITETSEKIGYAVQPIAVNAIGPGDIFKYDKPAPSDKPAIYTMNTGPRPGRNVKGLLVAFGEQDAPSMGQLGPANINLFGTGDVFRQMTRGAGAMKARSAVDSALHYLATHQENDGSWDAEKLEGAKAGNLADTALACLAFMGGGNTVRKGDYSRNVLRGLEFVMRQQKEDGLITQPGANLYTHAICTIALCEAYGRARDERVGAAAQKAIDYCQKAVNADGGWRYTAKSEISDLSVTAWFVQAFKTAKLAQVKADHAIFSQAISFLDSVTDAGASKDSSGVVTYQFVAGQHYDSNAHPALTCAGMMIRQFNGMGVKNHLMVKGAELTKAQPPTWNQKDFYYWYYATYAMHNMGGEYRIWWNQKVRDVLLEHQSRDGDHAGSWEPKGDRWAAAGGRAYTTALGALCLEVYYRYSEALNSFGTAPDLDELFLE